MHKKSCHGSLNSFTCFGRRSQLSLKGIIIGDLPGSKKFHKAQRLLASFLLGERRLEIVIV